MSDGDLQKEVCSCSTAYPVSEKLFNLRDFFNMHWDQYSQHPTVFIEPWHYKAVNAIRTCRTAVLGVDYYSCPDCGEISERYHSCKHRFCPSCSWADTLKWAETQTKKMMSIPHRHVTFTLPHSLHGLILRNKKAIFNILMRTAAETFKEWIRYKYGISCGIISVLHTFGEKKEMHVHVHMIVSWGGVDIKTGELREMEESFVSYNFIKGMFRNKFEEELFKMYRAGELNHDFSVENEIEFRQYIKKLNKTGWIFNIEPPMPSPKSVVLYIGRYSKRACISEYKITLIEGEFITFKYKDNRDRDENKRAKVKELRLHYSEFFPLLLQHVPLPYFKIVRYYGQYNHKSKIEEKYLYKNQESKEVEIEIKDEEEDKIPRCKSCKCTLEYMYTIYDLRTRDERTELFEISKHEHAKIRRWQNIIIEKAA